MSSARADSAADSADEARPLLTTARTTATTRTLSNYERLACCYDAWASWERPYVEAGFNMLELRHRDDYLEVGCGTGRLLAMAGHFGGRCLGVDLSPRMCEVARQHCVEELGNNAVGSRVRVVSGDAVQLLRAPPKGPDDDFFDKAACMFTLELFDEADAIQLLRGIRQHLRPKAPDDDNPSRLIVVSMSSDVKNKRSCAMSCYACCHRNCSCVVDCRPIDVVSWVNAAGFMVNERFVLPMYGLAVELVDARLPPPSAQ